MDHETQTPIITWGAGIRDPDPAGPSTWPSFTSKRSKDINQTDVAPLMASLIGSNFPQHSVGKLPLDFLKIHDGDKVKAKVGNALQIHEQYKAFKEQRTKTLLPPILPRSDPFKLELESHLQNIDRLVAKNNYREALKLADELYDQSLRGLFHYQRYHRLPLYIATSLSYVGFIMYTIIFVATEYTAIFVKLEAKRSQSANIFGFLGVFYSLLSTIGQNVPYHFFCYYSCPFIIWTLVWKQLKAIQVAPNQQKQAKELSKLLFWAAITIEALIQTFFDRRWLCLALALQIFLHLKWKKSDVLIWAVLCLFLMLFTFQPSVGKESQPRLVIMAAILSVIILSACYFNENRFRLKEWVCHVAYLIVSGLCVLYADVSFTHFLSWTIFVSAIPMALMSSNVLLWRLQSLVVALQSMYQLFSLTYEALFLTFLILTLAFWLQREFSQMTTSLIGLSQVKIQENAKERSVVNDDDLRRALTFVTFAIVSFFGTGNIASLNSFDPKSIQTLVTTFNPFLMGGLLLLKVILPFFLVALFAFCVQYVTHMPQKALFLIVMIFSDFMGLHFFFHVTDQGSWLDIGTSLSHFVIVEATVIFLQIMFYLASFSMTLKFAQTRKETESEPNVFIVKND